MIKVLVADDEEKVCRLIVSLIDWQQLDMQVVGTANNGHQALDMIGRLRPDIVITDIRMPGHDGLELVRLAKERYDNLQFIIISGYRHFDYAQNAIRYGVGDYLLKPINRAELHATLSRMRDEYRHSRQQITLQEQLEIRLQKDMDKLRCGLLNDLLQNRAVDMGLDGVNSSYHYAFRPGSFQMFILKIDHPNYADEGENAHMLEEKALYGLQSALKPVCYDTQVYLVGSRIYGVMNFAPEQGGAVRKTLMAALDDLVVQAGVFDMQLSIGLGGAEQDMGGLPGSLEQARAAVDQRYMEAGGRVIDSADFSQGFDSHSLLVDLQKQLGIALDIMDRDAVRQALDRLGNGALSAYPAPSGRELLALVMEAYSTCLVLLRNFGGREDIERLAKDMEQEADHLGSGRRLLGLLGERVLAHVDDILGRNKQEGIKPVRTAKQYINDNYMHPLTLDAVAEYVGFNSSYFSTLFKKESGQNFQDYISEVRMNRAKELLKDTNDTIASICGQVGYTDAKYFAQSFKRHTGLKPKEYRNLFS